MIVGVVVLDFNKSANDEELLKMKSSSFKHKKDLDVCFSRHCQVCGPR